LGSLAANSQAAQGMFRPIAQKPRDGDWNSPNPMRRDDLSYNFFA